MSRRFWDSIIRDQEQGVLADVLKFFLWMLSLMYGLAMECVNGLYASGVLRVSRLPRPVISVGNITVGGSGKTPMVIWLVRHLKASGLRPAVLTRGYAAEDAQGNDEVRMFRELCPDVPVIVGADRYRLACEFLTSHDVDCFVMDDGFQHRRLFRDLDLVVVESLKGFGNGYLLPRGILREPISGLRRADVVIVSKRNLNPSAFESVRQHMTSLGLSRDCVGCDVVPTGLKDLRTGIEADIATLKGAKVLAVSAIADPDNFHATLKTAGADVVASVAFPDHHDYQFHDADAIVRSAQQASMIVTTHKDAVKLKKLVSRMRSGIPFYVLNIDFIFFQHEQEIILQRIRLLRRT